MGRIRYLKPDFFLDEDLTELPHVERLAFAGLWCFADKEGRLVDSPKKLKAQIYPYERVDMDKILTNLTKKPFIHRYSIENRNYIQIINWKIHQKPHHTEKPSTIPEPINKVNIRLNTSNGDGKGNGDGECSQRKLELSNGSLTVKPPLKTQHLDFVTLTEKEHKKLVELLGKSQTASYIEKLNAYIGSTGKKYKSHYFTILSWIDRDGKSTTKKPKTAAEIAFERK